MLHCIAIDDEPIALNIIRAHAEKVTFLKLEAVFASATEALVYVQQQKVDLVFLDINMPDLSGIEFAKITGANSKIIFTTAYPEYAVQGFELAATDYLLKPISFARFLLASTRVQEQLNLTTAGSQPALDNFLYLKDGYNMVRINLDELLYIKADDNYLTFYEPQRRIVTRMRLSEAIKKLSRKPFLRVHKSYIVSLSKIEKIERHQLVIAAMPIPVSGNYRQELWQRLALS
ncbi:LytR/AlgR family response regulator transcription factor [Pontibacter silvestris]|uniref:LytR/AlgR family response regulator transcription factor n=1 Tax=Pontibacter silvestris TaxID=2305183 RepID=A0ABW4WTC0_9BACT|nr:LytTR family DNA-binding domain-containing protein [Pontibacter silvestris]MCC9138019.1 LytTR family DNA-binding domain-containing protein [Pontibacter silvestris]